MNASLIPQRLTKRAFAALLLHAIVFTLVYWCAYNIRFEFVLPASEAITLYFTLPGIVIIKSIAFYYLGHCAPPEPDLMADIIELHVNGTRRSVAAEPNDRLMGVLRDQLGLTGSKYGCGEGSCGACTVVIDGRAVRSCIALVSQCAGKQITTIEALEQDGKLHPLQQAFLDAGAMQCGYCTPGMIMSGVALLAENARPTPEQIVAALEGNICRCGTYQRIVTAIRQAAANSKGA